MTSGCGLVSPAGVRDQAFWPALAKRLRATSAAAAAPKSRTIGGAGTGAGGPPLEPVLPLPPPFEPCQPPFELQPPLLLHPALLDP